MPLEPGSSPLTGLPSTIRRQNHRSLNTSPLICQRAAWQNPHSRGRASPAWPELPGGTFSAHLAGVSPCRAQTCLWPSPGATSWVAGASPGCWPGMQGGAGEASWQGASALLRSSSGVSFGPVKTDSGSLWVGCGPHRCLPGPWALRI